MSGTVWPAGLEESDRDLPGSGERFVSQRVQWFQVCEVG